MTRTEAIKHIHNMIIAETVEGTTIDELEEALKMAIEALQERKTGKWVITARNGVLCSECKSGTRKMPMLFGNPLYKYCQFCGAKMEGYDE